MVHKGVLRCSHFCPCPRPLCVSKSALRLQVRFSTLAQSFLAICFLTLLLALPSHAQWQVQKPDGTTISPDNTGYPLFATQIGTTSTSYPPASAVHPDVTAVPLVYDFYQRVNYSAFTLFADNNECNQGYYGVYPTGIYTFPDYSWQPWNGAVSASLSPHLEADWVWAGTDNPPAYLDLLIATSGGVFAFTDYGNSQLSSGLTAQASLSDSLGDAISSSAGAALPGTNAAGGYVPLAFKHLVRVPVVGGVARVIVTGGLSGSASNPIPYGTYNGYTSTATNGITSAETSAQIGGSAQEDPRMGSLVALGHVPTLHKGTQVDPSTQLLLPELNVDVNDTLQVDTGITLWSQTPEPDSALAPYHYGIDYQGGISGAFSIGDAYTIAESLNGGSDGGTEPLGGNAFYGGRYAIDPLHVDYDNPILSYPIKDRYPDGSVSWDYSKPSLAPGDTGKIDGIDFNYTFKSDGAIAHKHLSVHLHLPTEWNQIGNLLGDPTLSPPYTSIACDPAMAEGFKSIQATGVDEGDGVAFAYQGVSAAFTGSAAFAAENPPLAAFLVVAGYVVDKAAPEVPADREIDTSADIDDAIKATQEALSGNSSNKNILFDNPDWIALYESKSNDVVAQKALQAECHWKLVQVTPYTTFHWLGDQYGAFGYTGQVKTDIQQPSPPLFLHYYYTPVTTTPVNPSP